MLLARAATQRTEGRGSAQQRVSDGAPESKYSRTMSRAAALKACTLGWKGVWPLPLSSPPGVPGVPVRDVVVVGV